MMSLAEEAVSLIGRLVVLADTEVLHSAAECNVVLMFTYHDRAYTASWFDTGRKG